MQTSVREVFRRFREVFRRFRAWSDLFLHIRIHLDTFGCFRKKKIVKKTFEKKSKKIVGSFAKFFDVFVRFRESWRQMDLKISFRIKFCFRYTSPEVYATRNREKMTCTRPSPALSPRLFGHAKIYCGGGRHPHLPVNIKW